MATIKLAVQNVTKFAEETLGPERVAGLQLEELESVDINGEDAWLITLSMIGPQNASLGASLNALAGKREYKTFTVLKKTGEVTSMKIRELAAT